MICVLAPPPPALDRVAQDRIDFLAGCLGKRSLIRINVKPSS
jgi:hypothetical protein